MYNLILVTNILRILDEKGMTKAELAEKAGMADLSLEEVGLLMGGVHHGHDGMAAEARHAP